MLLELITNVMQNDNKLNKTKLYYINTLLTQSKCAHARIRTRGDSLSSA